MKNFTLTFAILTWVFMSCDKHHGPSENVADKYTCLAASKLITLKRLIEKIPGFDRLVTARSNAHSGLTAYETVEEGMPSYVSLASPLIGDDTSELSGRQFIDWAAFANVAMARKLFPNR